MLYAIPQNREVRVLDNYFLLFTYAPTHHPHTIHPCLNSAAAAALSSSHRAQCSSTTASAFSASVVAPLLMGSTGNVRGPHRQPRHVVRQPGAHFVVRFASAVATVEGERQPAVIRED